MNANENNADSTCRFLLEGSEALVGCGDGENANEGADACYQTELPRVPLDTHTNTIKPRHRRCDACAPCTRHRDRDSNRYRDMAMRAEVEPGKFVPRALLAPRTNSLSRKHTQTPDGEEEIVGDLGDAGIRLATELLEVL